MENGKRKTVGIQASEKLYRDFELKVTSPGGHSSLPTGENAIYELAEDLMRLEHSRFPFELNEVTRAYFVTRSPFYNARMRTTCAATMLDGGHARNALPATARANVNCRVLPGYSTQEVQATLEKIAGDPHITITPVKYRGVGVDANPPTPLRADVMGALEKVSAQMWPGVSVIPMMDAGASDSSLTHAAGIPSYGVPGFFTILMTTESRTG